MYGCIKNVVGTMYNSVLSIFKIQFILFRRRSKTLIIPVHDLCVWLYGWLDLDIEREKAHTDLTYWPKNSDQQDAVHNANAHSNLT